MLDTSGNYSLSGGIITATSVYDETPPVITESTLVERTDTTVRLHLITNELLKKIRARYRVVGTTEWLEQELIPTALAFDINFAGLIAGQLYEYQYVLEDNSGNQTITEWEKV